MINEKKCSKLINSLHQKIFGEYVYLENDDESYSMETKPALKFHLFDLF